MTTIERLDRWQREGTLSEAEHASIAAIVRRDRVSLYLELNALLYLGVLAIAGGVAWTIGESFADIGDIAIILSLSLALTACFYFCVSRARPYDSERVESPDLAFDYVLYLGCLLFAIELGYLESRFAVLRGAWDYHVLLSALVFFTLAYRFDNRFVLSLALSTLAAWFGLKLNSFGWSSPQSLRFSAMVYGALVTGAGLTLHRWRIKSHFLETYLHVAANAVFVALLNGVVDDGFSALYVLALLGLAGLAIGYGLRHRRFAFVAYGVIYAYLGITLNLLSKFQSNQMAFSYLVVSGSAVIIVLVYLARTVGKEG